MTKPDLKAVERKADMVTGRQGEGPEAEASGTPQLFVVGTAVEVVQGSRGNYLDSLWRLPYRW